VASHYSDYDPATAELCERTLVTLVGDLGPWAERITLVGGLAPRYIVGELPAGVRHIGTNDIDVVLELFIEPPDWDAYRTLESNLRKSGFEPGGSTFQWVRRIGNVTLILEFLCETDEVAPGRIFKPKEQQAGHALGAVNVRGASLATRDASLHSVTAERLDGGRSTVSLRVTNLLPFVILKVNAFQERHEPKDAYDMIFCLLHHDGGPAGAAASARKSPVWEDAESRKGIDLLRARFAAIEDDGPFGYANFLKDGDDADAHTRNRREAHAAVAAFLGGL
jgi:hypothetical protein